MKPFEEKSLSSFTNQIKRISIDQKLVPTKEVKGTSMFDDKLYTNHYVSVPKPKTLKASQSQVISVVDDKAFQTRRNSNVSGGAKENGIPPAGKKKVTFKVSMPKK